MVNNETGDENNRSLAAATYQRSRREMVRRQIEARGVRDPAVLAAMRTVPRHEFVPEEHRSGSYEDGPLPIGWGQTISQPYVVAMMTELLDLAGGERVLEVGTGSGYQAAVLAEIAADVYTVEIVEPLARRAAETFLRLSYGNVHSRYCDGGFGWPELAPFDGILVTAAPGEAVPEGLLSQLGDGARLVAPVGGRRQSIHIYERKGDRCVRTIGDPVRFVPLTGEATGERG